MEMIDPTAAGLDALFKEESWFSIAPGCHGSAVITNSPGPAKVMAACPAATSCPPARTEMLALPGGVNGGTTTFTCVAVADTIRAAVPATRTPSGGCPKFPNTTANDPGASPCAARKLAPFTAMASPLGNRRNGAGSVACRKGLRHQSGH